MCFIHKKLYIGIRDGTSHIHPAPWRHEFSIQEARWQCRECGKLGSTWLYLSDGYHEILFGRLVPDSKRWANWGEKKP